MAFLLGPNNKLATKFLGVSDDPVKPAFTQDNLVPIPPPIQAYKPKAGAGTISAPTTKQNALQTPQQTMGPTTAPQATDKLGPKATGPLENTAQQNAQQYSDQSGAKVEANAAKPHPTQVQGERGAWTTDHDATTDLVYDKDANNKAEAAIAKTFVDQTGKVHYTQSNPDGSPMAPWEDSDGWSKLSEEQQKAVAQDFITKQQSYVDTQSKADSPLATKNWSQLDPAGKLAAAQAFVDGTLDPTKAATDDTAADAPKATPAKIITQGSHVGYAGTDENGNKLPPWSDAEGWAKLTPEQQQDLKLQYAKELETHAQDEQAKQDAGVAGTGIDEDAWAAMSPADQANALRGIKPPTQNPDGSLTYSEADGGSTTKDTSGNVLSRAGADGTNTVYGAAGVQTVTYPDGRVEATDSTGKTKTTFKPGSEAANRATLGFNMDGTQMSRWQSYATAKGIDPKNPTPKQRDQYASEIAAANVQQWSQGLSVATAAVGLGLLKASDYNAMLKSPYTQSFGAWLAFNKDVAAAVKNSNYPVQDPKQFQPSAFQVSPAYDTPDSYFTNMRQSDYVSPDSLQNNDYAGTDPWGVLRNYLYGKK